MAASAGRIRLLYRVPIIDSRVRTTGCCRPKANLCRRAPTAFRRVARLGKIGKLSSNKDVAGRP